ncbi:response regulator [Streptomyces sp. NPDC021224]|uniref:response regulator n=1 Tax=unclassified Streptomyces TaxID=2593676 RepID=UPI0037B8053C
MVRVGLRTILQADGTIEVVAEAGDGRAAVEAVARHRPDVVLLDIQMPGTDGLAAAANVRSGHPNVRVVMVTTFDDDGYIARAVELNVDGFLLKSADPHDLIGGVKAAVAGGTALSPTVARRVLNALDRGRLQRHAAARRAVESLTARERDVLVLVGHGLSNAQIARRLHLVEGTVKIHVSAILMKLGADNRVQAAIVAYQSGLTEPEGT